jgi:hypothetical protein
MEGPWHKVNTSNKEEELVYNKTNKEFKEGIGGDIDVKDKNM